jgi:phospholipid/cholesterol/gamma-HCH transport system substrate-binding protein
MIFGKSRLELKVGIFVFIALVILATFVLLIGNFKTWTSGYKVNFVFNFINGVKLGAPVRLSGLDVGEVKDIKLVYGPEDRKLKICVVGWLHKEAIIPADSTVWVNTLGLLGEKYIEVMPGKDYEHYLKENESLTGNDPIAMHEVAELLKNITDDLDQTILKIKNAEGTVGKLLSDDTIHAELVALIKGMEELVTDIKAHPWKLFRKTKEKPVKK